MIGSPSGNAVVLVTPTDLANAAMSLRLQHVLAMLACLLIATAGPSLAQLEQGIQFFEAERYDEAQTFFEAATRSNPSNAEAAFHLGRVFMERGGHDDATTWFRKAVDLEETSSVYHYWLGRAYGAQAQQAGIIKKATLAGKTKAAFLRAVELDGDNLDAREGMMQFYLQAPGIMGGSSEKAREQAEAIKQRDAFRGHMAFMEIYTQEEKYTQVVTECRAAIALRPDLTSPYFRLGYAYQNLNQYDQSLQAFEEGLAAHPDDLQFYYQIGRVGALSGQHLDRAEEAVKIFLERGTDETVMWKVAANFRLGNIYEHKGNTEAARAAYQETLRLDPDHKDAKKALKKLR